METEREGERGGGGEMWRQRGREKYTLASSPSSPLCEHALHTCTPNFLTKGLSNSNTLQETDERSHHYSNVNLLYTNDIHTLHCMYIVYMHTCTCINLYALCGDIRRLWYW